MPDIRLPSLEFLIACKRRRGDLRCLLGLGEVARGDQGIDQKQMQAEEVRTECHSLCGARRGGLVIALAERLVGGLRRRIGFALQRRTAIRHLGAGARAQDRGEQKRSQRRPKSRLAQVFSAPIAHATSAIPIPLNFDAEL
ncbi:hypothetical protein [Bradyrhizobium icense]|uniref:hypothetical protein n=1 Tax=Bradyrhizobium icense TaxID=1274631 RepID=UPI0018D4ABD9|nr:hypothetical protein [Bradyrhizobium icense]